MQVIYRGTGAYDDGQDCHPKHVNQNDEWMTFGRTSIVTL